MKMNTFTVNEKGINEIKEILANHHKKYQGEIHREQFLSAEGLDKEEVEIDE